MSEETCIIGESTQVKGRITGNGHVEVEGQVDGHVALDGTLTVQPQGFVQGEIESTYLNVKGRLDGEVQGNDLITLEDGCNVTGKIRAPRIVILEGAKFKGQVDMDVEIQQLDF